MSDTEYSGAKVRLTLTVVEFHMAEFALGGYSDNEHDKGEQETWDEMIETAQAEFSAARPHFEFLEGSPVSTHTFAVSLMSLAILCQAAGGFLEDQSDEMFDDDAGFTAAEADAFAKRLYSIDLAWPVR